MTNKDFKSTYNEKRFEDFKKCLGNGKGRVTDEDENPENFDDDCTCVYEDKKFNLSDKIIGEELDTNVEPVINIEDVKEFIRLLKDIEIWNCSPDEYLDKLNMLVGEKLK